MNIAIYIALIIYLFHFSLAKGESTDGKCSSLLRYVIIDDFLSGVINYTCYNPGTLIAIYHTLCNIEICRETKLTVA